MANKLLMQIVADLAAAGVVGAFYEPDVYGISGYTFRVFRRDVVVSLVSGAYSWPVQTTDCRWWKDFVKRRAIEAQET